MARRRASIPRRRSFTGLAGILTIVGVSATVVSRQSDVESPFAWLAPEIRITPDKRERMDRRDVVTQVLPAEDDRLALFLASAVRVDPATYLRRTRASATLWTSVKVPHVVRFSSPPDLDDLARVELDPGDLEALRQCAPEDCDVKLSAREIERIRAAIQRRPNAWQDTIQDEFRRILLHRTVSYQARGLHVDPYADKSPPVSPRDAFEDALRGIPLIARRFPRLAAYFREYPGSSLPNAHSFLCWLQTRHTPKPTIQILHVVILPNSTGVTGAEVLVAWRQVYATHYLNAFLSVSVLLQDRREPQRRYLVNLNGSTLDGLDGWFGGVARYFVERGARDGAKELFETQRQRLEQ